MKRKADSVTVPAEGSKDSAGSKKRKLSESEDFIPPNTTDKEARKKAKKDKKEKKDRSEKKEKKEKSKDKKEKKEKKDKKRKAEEAVEGESQPASAGLEDEVQNGVEGEVKKPKKEKKDKKEKKEKKDKKDKKSKKDKTKKHSVEASAETKAEAKDEEPEAVNGAEEDQAGKREKYIVFIGNLPYSATTDAIRAHFASVKPTAVRLLTQRDNPSKSRGIAFLEFGTYGHMKSCLEHFHHSEFNDGVSPARKINVELTAGGGGKKEARQEKIKQKNKSLDEERAKRLAKEEAAKKEKEAEKRPKPESQEDMIHPSRRGQVPKGRR